MLAGAANVLTPSTKGIWVVSAVASAPGSPFLSCLIKTLVFVELVTDPAAKRTCTFLMV